MTRNITLLMMLLSLLVLTPDTYAVWGWMRGAAVEDFTEADWDLVKSNARSTLDSAADGEQVNWHNEESGNKGAMKVIMTFQYDNQTCRRMAVLSISRKGQRGVANYNLCQQPDTTWMFVADSVVVTENS